MQHNRETRESRYAMSKGTPKIKHIAIMTMNPKKAAQFYCDVFDMKVVHRNKKGNYFISDGYITLALLRNVADGRLSGINHLGFHIADIKKVEKRLKKYDVYGPTARPADRPFAEVRVTDPEGVNIDLSVQGFDRVRPGSQVAASRAKRATSTAR
jgi:catechol 2,3-dioxygenase-like lactoylglutathione lyase family enzyme